MFSATAIAVSLSLLVPAAGVQDPPVQNASIRKLLAEVSAQRIERDVENLAGFGTRHVLSDTESSERGTGAARRYLEQEMNDAVEGRWEVRVVPFEKHLGRSSGKIAKMVNIIAFLPGTDPERGAWVFGGHYDTRNSSAFDGEGDSPGADDDGSGTAAILEMTRVLAGVEFKADVYLCAFDGEEHGLFGSDHLAEQLHQDGVVVEGMITNDIIGASHGPDGTDHSGWMRCFSEGFPANSAVNRQFQMYAAEVDGPSRQLARFAALMGERYQPDFLVRLMYRPDRFGRGGDHRSFTKRGDPGIRFTEAAENYDHQHQNVREEDGVQYGDLPEFCDFDYIAKVTRVNLAVLLNGAGAPPAPTGIRLQGAVRHHTEVRWQPVEDKDLAGYRVWTRRTDSSRWEQSQFVPASEDRTLLEYVSIDDYHFAVSSVARDGRESPPRFPHQFTTAEEGEPTRRGR